MIGRRHVLEQLSLILGGALSPQLTAAVMGQVTNHGPSVAVTAAQETLLAEVAEVIIPETDTPGAKAAGTHEFILRVLRDCHVLEEQEAFYAGLAKIDETSHATHGRAFVDLAEQQRIAVVEEIRQGDAGFFRQLKQLTVTGYFTSEIGATEALAYLPIPGRFEGDVPMQPGQKAWAISR